MRRVAEALLIAAALLAGIWFLAPREVARLGPVTVDLPADLDAWAAATEDGVRPGTARRILWAGTPGAQTDLALVYLHGFSASAEELRPVPQMLARELGANLFLARLSGHGRDGAALAAVSADDWWRDTAEAVAVGQRIGRRVVLIGTSTGGTLAAEAARDPVLGPHIAGVVFVSPNFGLRQRGWELMTWPLARVWLPWLMGRERCFQTLNAEHAAGWTPCYPTVAVLPMAALLRHVRRGGWGTARAPALFVFAEDDRIVDTAATRTIAARWGGPAQLSVITPGPGDDPGHHVIAGDILSPGMTAPVAALIADWLRALPE